MPGKLARQWLRAHKRGVLNIREYPDQTRRDQTLVERDIRRDKQWRRLHPLIRRDDGEAPFV
jgi:hypothetical protein